MTTLEEAEQKFRESMVHEVRCRGYTNVEVVGSSVVVGRGNVRAVSPDGQRVRLSCIVPDNQTTIRRRHFRIRQIATGQEE